MRIYTKRGDKGKTSLYGDSLKQRFKDEQRIISYGTVDELNSMIGVVLSNLPQKSTHSKILLNIQSELLEIGSELATAPRKKPVFRMDESKVKRLEDTIDALERKLPELKNFILPGGSRAGASLHLARTICRRAEREVVGLSGKEKVNAQVMVYLNRLSDLLFVLARSVNRFEKKKEAVWRGRARADSYCLTEVKK